MSSRRAGRSLANRAGSAVVWQMAQLVGVKLVYLGRVVVLGRLLAPEDFGLFAVALIALDFLLSATNFGMVPALVHRPDARREHYEAAWTIGLLRSLLVASCLVAFAPAVAELFGEPRAAPLLRVLAVRPILAATASMGVARLKKELRFRSLAGLHLSEAAINAGVSIALVAPLGVWALVAGPVVASLAYAILSYLVAPLRPRLRLAGAESGQLVRYGRWIMVSAWIALAGHTLLQMGISRFLGAAPLGLYFMAGKLGRLPSEISTDVVGSVAFPVFAQVQDDDDRCREAFRAAVLALSVLVIPASMLILALAPTLAVDVLGDHWRPAIPLIRILAIVNVTAFFGDVAVPLLEGTGRPDRRAHLDAILYALLLITAWILMRPFGVVGAVAAWIPGLVASQIVSYLYVSDRIPRPLAGLGKPLVIVVLATGLGVLVAVSTDHLVDGMPGAVAAGLVGLIVAFGAIGAVDRHIDIGLATTAVRLFPPIAPILGRVGFRVEAPRDGVRTDSRHS